jgi:SAM-dependent methyltransferase
MAAAEVESPWAGSWETAETLAGERPLPDYVLEEIRRSRREPRPTEFAYLLLRRLARDLADAVARIPGPVDDVVDIYCGTSPYRDLFAPGTRYVTLDINRRYGIPDVETTEFLPLDDASFDVAWCISAFHYVADSAHGEAELRRILRPGGTAVLSVPCVLEYDPHSVEHRYTGPELERLFAAWDDVRIVETGGRGISWAFVNGAVVNLIEQGLSRRLPFWRVIRAAFLPAYLMVNVLGALLEIGESRFARTEFKLPANVLLTARRPA